MINVTALMWSGCYVSHKRENGMCETDPRITRNALLLYFQKSASRTYRNSKIGDLFLRAGCQVYIIQTPHKEEL